MSHHTNHYRAGSRTITYKHNENSKERLVVDYQVAAEVPDGLVDGEGHIVLTIPMNIDGAYHMRSIEFSPTEARALAGHLQDASIAARVSQSESDTDTH